jgi:hypothetical protein
MSKGEKAYRFVNLREQWDPVLLDRFYNELLIPCFPIKEELQSLERMQSRLDPTHESLLHPKDYVLNVLLTIDEQNDDKKSVMAGGIAFEYYKTSRFGLYTYFAVDPRYRGQGLVSKMVKLSIPIFDKTARSHCGKPCLLRVLESNATGVEDGVMNSVERLKIHNHLGFGELKFDYVQPPLEIGADPFYGLILLAHKDSPGIITKSDGSRVVAGEHVRAFLRDFFHACVGYEAKPSAFEELVCWKKTIKKLDDVKEIVWNPTMPFAGPHFPPPGALKHVKDGAIPGLSPSIPGSDSPEVPGSKLSGGAFSALDAKSLGVSNGGGASASAAAAVVVAAAAAAAAAAAGASGGSPSGSRRNSGGAGSALCMGPSVQSVQS